MGEIAFCMRHFQYELLAHGNPVGVTAVSIIGSDAIRCIVGPCGTFAAMLFKAGPARPAHLAAIDHCPDRDEVIYPEPR